MRDAARARHVVVHQSDLSVECQRCGRREALQLPAPATRWLSMARAFQRVHAECPASIRRPGGVAEDPRP